MLCNLLFSLNQGASNPFFCQDYVEALFVIAAWHSMVCMCVDIFNQPPLNGCRGGLQIVAIANPAAVNGCCLYIFCAFV